jgi:O-methyltransferase involved in polyketide biosynthesis
MGMGGSVSLSRNLTGVDLVVTEGLLIYFTPEEIASLAGDIALGTHYRLCIIDLASPGQLKRMQRSTAKQLSEANAAFKFGPQKALISLFPMAGSRRTFRDS